MSRTATIVILSIILLSVIGGAMFLFNKNQEPDVIFATESPFVSDLVKKTVATGSIVPRKEIEIKPLPPLAGTEPTLEDDVLEPVEPEAVEDDAAIEDEELPTIRVAPRVIDIGVGGDTACARRDDGAIYCWGDLYRGSSARPRREIGRASGRERVQIPVVAG